MDAGLDYWPESYSDLCSSTGNDDSYPESGDVEFDVHCPSLATDSPGIESFIQSVSLTCAQV